SAAGHIRRAPSGAPRPPLTGSLRPRTWTARVPAGARPSTARGAALRPATPAAGRPWASGGLDGRPAGADGCRNPRRARQTGPAWVLGSFLDDPCRALRTSGRGGVILP